MCMTSQPSGCPSDPAHRPTVARLTGFKRRGRNVRRSQLLCFQWIYERTGARHALLRLRTHVETRSAPGTVSLGQLEQVQELGMGDAMTASAPQRLDRLADAEVAPGGDHRAPCRRRGRPARRARRRRRRCTRRARTPEPPRRLEQRRRMRLGVRRGVAADHGARRARTGRSARTSGLGEARRLVGDDAPGQAARSQRVEQPAARRRTHACRAVMRAS